MNTLAKTIVLSGFVMLLTACHYPGRYNSYPNNGTYYPNSGYGNYQGYDHRGYQGYWNQARPPSGYKSNNYYNQNNYYNRPQPNQGGNWPGHHEDHENRFNQGGWGNKNQQWGRGGHGYNQNNGGHLSHPFSGR